MEETKKLTKKDYYEMIRKLVETTELENKNDLIDFIDHQVSILETKAEKAKERAAMKRVEGDSLRDAVQAVMTESFQSVDEITAQVQNEEEEISKSKVIARLTNLINNGIVIKEKAKTEDKKEITVYKLA